MNKTEMKVKADRTIDGLLADAAEVSIGTVSTISATSTPVITNTGIPPFAVLNFQLPVGSQGFINTSFNHVESSSLAGPTTMTLLASDFGLVGGFNGPGIPALNDSFRTVKFQVTPGTYSLRFVAPRGPDRGFVTWYLDNSVISFGGIDLYRATADTIIRVFPGLVIGATDENIHYLRAEITKNPNSSGYYVYLGQFWLRQ